MNMKKFLALIKFCCIAILLNAQPPEVKSVDILNAKSIPFLKDSVLRIMHIGDSHIQADWFSGMVNQQLKQKFGAAGRGLIFPYRQIKTNGSPAYKTTSNQLFPSQKIVQCKSSCEVGFAAYNALLLPNREFTVRLKQDTAQQYINVWYKSEMNEHDPIVNQDQNPGSYFVSNHSGFTVSTYLKPINQTFSIQSTGPITLYGVTAYTQSSGVVYHNIGANGAKFNHYNQSNLFFEQTKLLQPHLIIVSLGTNESVGDLIPDTFLAQLDTFYQNIVRHHPNAQVLFTTPADNYVRKTFYTRKKVKGKWRKKKVVRYVSNPTSKQVRDLILNYCNTNNVMVWDLYEAMGGEGSMRNWVKTGYAAKDHIHFSKGGYELQGKLLFDSLIKLIAP